MLTHDETAWRNNYWDSVGRVREPDANGQRCSKIHMGKNIDKDLGYKKDKKKLRILIDMDDLAESQMYSPTRSYYVTMDPSLPVASLANPK